MGNEVKPIRYMVTSEIPSKGNFAGSRGWVVVKDEDDAKRRQKMMEEAGAIASVVPLYDKMIYSDADLLEALKAAVAHAESLNNAIAGQNIEGHVSCTWYAAIAKAEGRS